MPRAIRAPGLSQKSRLPYIVIDLHLFEELYSVGSVDTGVYLKINVRIDLL